MKLTLMTSLNVRRHDSRMYHVQDHHHGRGVSASGGQSWETAPQSTRDNPGSRFWQKGIEKKSMSTFDAEGASKKLPGRERTGQLCRGLRANSWGLRYDSGKGPAEKQKGNENQSQRSKVQWFGHV